LAPCQIFRDMCYIWVILDRLIDFRKARIIKIRVTIQNSCTDWSTLENQTTFLSNINKMFSKEAIYMYLIQCVSLWSYGSRICNYNVPVQSVPITTKVVSSNPVHGEVYSIQHYVIKIFNDLQQVKFNNKSLLNRYLYIYCIYFCNLIRKHQKDTTHKSNI
jgi:hypothetical protein